jgi:hypothetical protein
MMRRRISLALGSIFLLLATSCGEKENPLGEGLIDTGLSSRADSLVLCPVTETVSFQFLCPSPEDECQRGPATQDELLVGAGYGYRAILVLSFASVPVDSQVVVDSAWVRLTTARALGDAPTDLTVHALLDTLIEGEVLYGDTLAYDPAPLPVTPVYEGDGLRMDFTEVAADWYTTPGLRGLALMSHDAGPSFGYFRSVESFSVYDTTTTYPILSVFTHPEGDTTSTEYTHIAGDDTYLLWWDPSVDSLSTPQDRISIGKGLATRSLLMADVSHISREATINRARLILHVDGGASYFDSLDVRVHLAEEEWNGSQTEFQTLSSGSGWVTQDSAVVDVKMLVQVWTADLLENHGFLLKTYGEQDNVDFIRFFGPTHADAAVRPTLIVEYSVPPLPWHQQ